MDCAYSCRCLTEDGKEATIQDLNKTLCGFAREENLDALYEALECNPKVLDEIDKIPFVHTPLHEAVAHTPTNEATRAEFALELLSLKPSFGKKLNPDGQSPLHLALSKGFSALAKRLIEHDSELIRVKGRGGKTPLHCVAEIGDAETNLLAEFLFACPEAIKDLTIRKETAFHIAVKKGQYDAFRLIFEWIWRSYNGELLIWKDDEGNTVLHIATSTKQLRIVKYIISRAPIIKDEKNSKDKTALDIAEEQGEDRIKDVLSGRVKVRASHGDAGGLIKGTTNLDELLLSREPYFEKFLRFILFCRRELSLDMRNMVLVVAVLIATATYQDLGTVNFQSTASYQDLGTVNFQSTANTRMSLGKNRIAHFGNVVFLYFNTISFTASIAVMISVLSLRPFTSLLHLSLVFLAMSYGYKMAYISKVQSAIPILLIILLVYSFKLMYFKSMEREIKMEMPAIWIELRPRWRALTPTPVPLTRLRMVYQLLRC